MKHLRTFLSISIFILTAFSICADVTADGMAYVKSYDDESGWSLMDEESQTAFINYQDNTEKMIISIKIGNISGTDAVWLFPIPSEPENIRIDTLNNLPNIKGDDFTNIAKKEIGYILLSASATQIYPLPLFVISQFSQAGMMQNFAEGTDSMKDTGITIHQHEEKMGMTTEVITVRNTEAFYDYLGDKDLVLPEDARSIIEEYSGKEYSFVVSWIMDLEEFKKYALDPVYVSAREYYDNRLGYRMENLKYTNLKLELDNAKKYGSEEDIEKYQRLYDEEKENMYIYASLEAKAETFDRYSYDIEKPLFRLGVDIEFPAEEIYFPLRPTSIYGQSRIAVDVFVLGFTEPEVYDSISEDTKVSYLYHRNY